MTFGWANPEQSALSPDMQITEADTVLILIIAPLFLFQNYV